MERRERVWEWLERKQVEREQYAEAVRNQNEHRVESELKQGFAEGRGG